MATRAVTHLRVPGLFHRFLLSRTCARTHAAGVGYTRNVFLKSGDTVRITIEGIGSLRNIVAGAL